MMFYQVEHARQDCFSVTFWIIPVAISCARRIKYNTLLKEVCDLWPLLGSGDLYFYQFFQHMRLDWLLEQKPDAKTVFSGSPESVRDLWVLGVFSDYC